MLNPHRISQTISLPPVPWRQTPGITWLLERDDPMSDVTITYEDGPTKARYVARAQGHAEEAELTVSKMSDRAIIVDHTFVPEALRGLGIAGKLAERVIADARAAGQTIVPLCPFFKAYAVRHTEEVGDVVQ